jgi:hypothetical protein
MASKPKGHQWQKQADHFNAVLNDMQSIVDDPTSVPQEVAEAQQTIQDMTVNLARLKTVRGVTPQAEPAEKEEPEKPAEPAV